MPMKSPPYSAAAITGASTGIGRALAIELARRGVSVGLLARSADRLAAVAGEIRDAGGRAVTAACDVAEPEQIATAAAAIRQELGFVDLAIANAGIGHPVEPGSFDLEGTERLYRVNVLGALRFLHAFLPEMRERGEGHLVGVGSIAGYFGIPGNGDSCGTKAALRIEMESLRALLRKEGVAVTTICPGFIRTPLTDKNDFDMPFLMESEPAARKMVRAIVRRKRVYDFPWPMALLARFARILPRWAFDRIAMRSAGRGGRTQALSGEGT
jgi:short-subunit dehydrogenase